MNSFFRYLILFIVIIFLSRFFGLIIGKLIRFWYILLPAVILWYLMNLNKKKKADFHKKTGLDPEKEVHLKEEPKIEEED